MRKRTLGAVLIAGLALSGAGAFTNSNSVADSTAGVGAGAVSGVSVSDVDYTLSQAAVTGEDEISAVAFTAATSVAGKNIIVRLKGASGVLTSADNISDLDVCTVSGGTGVSCSFLAVNRADLVAVTGLELVVYDND